MNAPSCPLCSSTDHVERSVVGAKHQKVVWLCGSCWTAFTGSEDEWREYQERRVMYAAHKRAMEAAK